MLLPALALAVMPGPFQRDGNAQVAPPHTVSTVGARLDRKDSTRALKTARKAQRDFEGLRRRLLPMQSGLSEGTCDVVIGRYCQWQQESYGPPPENRKVVERREKLLAVLDSVGRLLPEDQWVLAQKTRYLLEAEREEDANTMATSCAARATASVTRAWCLALAGYTAHRRGDYSRADSAFTRALAEMPEAQRCEWQDLSIMLDGKAAGQYKKLSCAARDSAVSAFLRLVQPLYLTGVNDFRTEFFARVTRMHIEADTPTPMSPSWGRDDEESLMRYGGGLWWTQELPPAGSGRAPVVASHRRGPSFNFFPDPKAIVAPEELRLEDWVYVDALARTRYAPQYVQYFDPLINQQVALFRRGDSALIVAAFDVTGYGAFDNKKLQAGVFAAVLENGGVSEPVGGAVQSAGPTTISTMSAPWRPLVVSLEVYDRDSRAAGRARYSVKPPANGTRLGLSDIMLYTPRDSMPKRLTDALPHAMRGLRVPNSRRLGLFWEMYGVREGGEVCDFSLLVEPIGQSWARRVFSKLRIVDEKRGLSLQWRESPLNVDGIASRSLNVDLSMLKPGRYRVRLALTPSGDVPVVTTRDVEIPN
ncbi:MAG: hypothetical protein ACRENU_10970 [Gemmatimonadaceae bacterium]